MLRKKGFILALTMVLLVSLLVSASALFGSRKVKGEEGPTEKVTLEMWQHGAGEAETNFYKSRIKEFNKAHENIEVELNVIARAGGNDYENKLSVARASGDLPDIVDMDGPYVANYAYSGVLQSMDKYIDKDSEWFKDFSPANLQQGTWNDKIYALGAMESSVVMYYNKDMMEKIGVQPPEKVENAWTYQEMYEVLQKLKQEFPDNYPLTGLAGDQNEWLTYMASPFLWSNNGDLISEDGLKAEGHINSEENIEAMEKIQKLFEEDLVVQEPGEQPFARQKSALHISGPWGALILQDYPEVDWGITPVFKFDKHFSATGSWAWGISSQCEHPEAAAEVIKWMTNKESAVRISEATGMPPTKKSAYSEVEKFDFDSYPMNIIQDQNVKTGRARPRTPAYPVLTQNFQTAYYNIISGADPEKALNKVADEVDRYIERRIGDVD